MSCQLWHHCGPKSQRQTRRVDYGSETIHFIVADASKIEFQANRPGIQITIDKNRAGSADAPSWAMA
jgi:hypothetical protein